jgi:hypothetical protein
VKPSVVEPVDVLGDSDLEVVDALVGTLVPDQLGLEQRVECLSQGVVLSVTAGPDCRAGADLGESLGVAHREVFNALVRVRVHTGGVLAGVRAGPQARLEGVRARSVAGSSTLPAHHAAGVDGDDGNGVDPAGEGLAVGDVRDPDPVRCPPDEAPVEEIRTRVWDAARLGRAGGLWIG